MSADQPRVLPHEYDGIQEYDNPMPGWWKGIFIATIVFSIGYGYWFHLGGLGVSERAEFDRDWQAYLAWKAEAEQNTAIVVTEASLAELAKDAGTLDAGRKVFSVNCVGCHLDDGRGELGPNLTDDHQIYGVDRMRLYQTISYGVPDKGMLSWGNILPPRDLVAVAAYVTSLQGSNVPGGKYPQGGKLPPWKP